MVAEGAVDGSVIFNDIAVTTYIYIYMGIYIYPFLRSFIDDFFQLCLEFKRIDNLSPKTVALSCLYDLEAYNYGIRSLSIPHVYADEVSKALGEPG